jgi:hypothetical protein
MLSAPYLERLGDGSWAALRRAKESWTDIGKKTASDREEQEPRIEQRGAIAGSVLGVLTFLGGVALYCLTFKLAYTMFSTDPMILFGVTKNKPLDLNGALATGMWVLVRILLLMVMAIVSGSIVKHGIHLYADSRSAKSIVIRERGPEPPHERSKREDEFADPSRRERLG